ncbi:haloacid dehalogenase-like hydrolase [Acetobacter conturbans]|uniref:phosphoserine phosphatase n=1 Tax=Acetobacter conturbans TaxID=1737472 RepID=A0ABX0K2X6_9PROT|nr:haloacid dehalogenase-like hydrolase [Acetobacter conturbans]NHN90056.1 hypothetical protein [Acetobacter conturbans]
MNLLSRRIMISGSAVGAVLGAGITAAYQAKGAIRESSSVPDFLTPLKWAPRNRSLLKKLISDYGTDSPTYNPAYRPYAVFDWDNTCIAGDCEETLLRYVVTHFVFALSPSDFARLVVRDIPDKPLNDVCRTVDNHLVSFPALVEDLVADYTELARSQRTPKMDDPIFLSFRSKLQFFYDALCLSYEDDVSCRWIVRLFSGWSREKLEVIAKKSNLWNLAQGIHEEQWVTPDARPGRAGRVSSHVVTGLRLTPEIACLQAALEKNGIDVFICSASLEDIVAVFATDAGFGYGLKRQNIIGMRSVWSDGRLGSDGIPDWPVTVGKGKVAALHKVVTDKRGYGPILVCGDSSGDYAMMTAFSDTRHALIVNRCLGGKIGELSKQAAAEMTDSQPRFLLQGRDANIGEWYPSERGVRLGTEVPELLAASQ